MNEPKLKTLVRIGIDFDNTICHSHYDSEADKWIMGIPFSDVKESLEKVEELGFKPWIFTSRPGAEEIEIWEWLKRGGLKKYIHGVITGKPLFKVVIDDRSIRFRGDWESCIKQLEGIK